MFTKNQNSGLKLDKTLEIFIDNESQRNKSPATLINYQADLKAFLEWLKFQGKGPSHVGPQDIGRYGRYLAGKEILIKKKNITDWLSKIWIWVQKKFGYHPPIEQRFDGPLRRPLGPASRRRHITVLKMFFRFLIDSQSSKNPKILRNPVNSIHAVKLKDIDVFHTRRLEYKDFETLIKKNKSIKEQFVLHLLYLGGLRLAELCILKVEDFHIPEGYLRLIRKGGSIHNLKIQKPDLIFKLFHDYCFTFNIHAGPLFFDLKRRLDPDRPSVSQRSMYSYIRRMLKKSLMDHENLGPHSFRKGCATELYKLHKDLLLVRNYLNHKDAKVTQTYIDYE